MVLAAAKELGLDYKVRKDGTYCNVSGPCYESKAECRFLRSIGGDSVGMSTVPEVIAARHCGMKILGLSLITNKVVTSNEQTVHASHAEVLQAVESSGLHVEAIVRHVISKDVIGAYLAGVDGPNYNMEAKNRGLPVVAKKCCFSFFCKSTSGSSSNNNGGCKYYNVKFMALAAASIAAGLFLVIKANRK